jgi:hypothetical protein
METQERRDRIAGTGELDSATTLAPVEGVPTVETEESVFAVLAARARTHSRLHLLVTTVIGAVDAIALGWAHPSLWPLAALFAAAGAYGAWGLADRSLTDHAPATPAPFRRSMALAVRVMRDMAAVAGVVAALAAVAGIWDASLGGWRH